MIYALIGVLYLAGMLQTLTLNCALEMVTRGGKLPRRDFWLRLFFWPIYILITYTAIALNLDRQ